MRTRKQRTLRALVAFLLVAPAAAQELPVLDPAVTRWITQEVSGDAAFEHIRFMTTAPHRPRAGANGLMTVARYYEERARAIGLSDVKLVRQADDTRPWNARFADLWLVSGEPERLASTLQTPIHLADFSRAADVTAEIVDLGAAADRDYEGKEVKGKLVLSYGSLGGTMREAVQKRGAAGVIWYPSPFSPGHGISGGVTMPDQVPWVSIASDDGGVEGGGPPTFAFVLSLRQGLLLRQKIANAKEPLQAHAVVDASFTSEEGSEPWQVLVEALLPGTDPDAHQDVVFTGHLQEGPYSANDDASGCASTLELARALHALVESGRIPRPKRTLRFWWTTEISSERQHFADHPELVRELWVNVNQDMVGANQALDVMRKQCVTRLPAARFHFLNDVMESVVEHVVARNNFELAQLQNGIPLYPEALVAHKGTWHRFNAEAIFFHNNTDHMTFLEAPIGIPGITFTNMPDRFIHSSDDELWAIDATQLGRCSASAALIGYTMASADAKTLPRLAAEVIGRGAARVASNVRVALDELAQHPGDAAAAYGALDQVRYAAERERSALRSLADAGATAQQVDAWLAALSVRETQAAGEVEAFRRQVGGGGGALAARASSEAETRLAKLRPSLTGGPKEFLAGREKVPGVPGLHDLMAFEVLNYVNGTRTGLDIARLVAAEAREGGERLYGTVTPESVLAYLENVAKAGLIRIE